MIIDSIITTIQSNTENRDRDPANTYDAGESIGCFVSGYNSMANNSNGAVPPVHVDLVYLDTRGNIIRKLTLVDF